MSKLALKMYSRGMTGNLEPLYGDIKDLKRDIHRFNKQSIMDYDRYGAKSGFATVGINKRVDDKLQRREIFEDMLAQVIRAAGTDTDNHDLVKVLGDRFIEDDAEYPGPLTHSSSEQAFEEYAKDVLCVDIDTLSDGEVENLIDYDDPEELERFNQWAKGTNRYEQDDDGIWWPSRHVNGYDIQRDTLSEFRARDLTPLEIIDYAKSPKGDELDEIVQLISDHLSSKAYDKKYLLKELRDKYKLSPFTLQQFAWDLPSEHNKTRQIHKLNQLAIESHMSRALAKDAARKIADEVFRQEDQYVSDLRTKMLIPAVKRRYD